MLGLMLGLDSILGFILSSVLTFLQEFLSGGIFAWLEELLGGLVPQG